MDELVKYLTKIFFKNCLTNRPGYAIIQSQVEGNRTRAEEGKVAQKYYKMVTKKIFHIFLFFLQDISPKTFEVSK